jgi:hypothetical protein
MHAWDTAFGVYCLENGNTYSLCGKRTQPIFYKIFSSKIDHKKCIKGERMHRKKI